MSGNQTAPKLDISLKRKFFESTKGSIETAVFHVIKVCRLCCGLNFALVTSGFLCTVVMICDLSTVRDLHVR